jgi:hypothetical protein
MKGRHIRYSADEMAWLEAHRLLPISDYYAAFTAAFCRDDVSAQNLHALRKRKGWKTGRTGHFEKGREPWSKGRKCPPGKGGRHPNAVKTQFRKGNRSGIAARVYVPIGTERIRDGYLVRKINDDFPLQARWRGVHLLNWEAINGPLPKGHALKCLDGNRLNCDPSNWEAVSRGVLARLNGGRTKRRLPFDQAAEELKPTVMALAKLEQRAMEARLK